MFSHSALRVGKRDQFDVQPITIYADSSPNGLGVIKTSIGGVVCIRNTGSFEDGLLPVAMF